MTMSREAQLFVAWVALPLTHAGVGFHTSTQPTFILYLIPLTYLLRRIAYSNYHTCDVQTPSFREYRNRKQRA
jgi:hypothetical protein